MVSESPIDIEKLKVDYRRSQKSRNGVNGRDMSGRPAIWDYDYLIRFYLLNDIVRFLSSKQAPLKALDIGAGQSPYQFLAEKNGWRFETLDVDASSHPDHVGDLENVKLPNSSYDLILCTQVLEHCSAPRGVMREIARLLKPGGEVIFSAPQVWFYHPHPSDFWRFTPEGLVEVAAGSGLKPMEMRAQGGSVAAVFQVINFSLYGAIGRLGAPFYFVFNLMGRLFDAIVPNPYFALNFCCRAIKP